MSRRRTSPVRLLVVVAVLGLVAGGGRLVAPLAVRAVIDDDLDLSTVDRVLPLALVGVLVAGVASWGLHRVVVTTIERALAAVRRSGIERVHALPPASREDLGHAGLVSRLGPDLDAVTTFVSAGGVQLWGHLCQMVVAAVIMLVFCAPLTLGVIAIAAVMVLAMIRLQAVVAQRFDEVRRAFSGVADEVGEMTAGIGLVHATASEARTAARLEAASEATHEAQRRTLWPMHAGMALGEVAISTMTVLVVVGGTWWAVGPLDLSTGDVVALVFLVTFFVRPLQGAVQSFSEAQGALAGWRRAIELLDLPVPAAAAARELPRGPLAVRLEHVDLAYGDAAPVVSGLTLNIAAGEHVALVGRTGSGKSTIARALTRQLDPAGGRLLLGGVEVLDLAPDGFTSRVCVVGQDPFLFDTTVLANILLGRPGADEHDVRRVLASLSLLDWAEALPHGLRTRVGSRGESLAVGERQLVALARTALVDPDLLVLDEATSGVDPATEARLQSALAVVTRGRTTVTIAHRLAAARAADRVLVLADGRLVEDGPHPVLAAADGPYSRLFTVWSDDHLLERNPIP